jgi:hypothetical protein
MFADSLIFPVLILAFAGWLVPRLLSRVWPEGLRPLLALGLVATLVMVVVAALVFIGLYLAGGVPLAALTGAGMGAFVLHFGHLALISGLFWGPILILSVAGLPKYWVRERW